MKVVKLEAEHYKRLNAVEVTPKGNTVVVAGNNAQGKTSVLDSIVAAVAGAKGAKETTLPIKDGERRASVVVTLDDLIVTRRWTQTGSTLEVTPRDGKTKLAKPQQVLDKLIGDLSFDPLAFAEAKPADQRAMLLDLVDLDVDPDKLDRQRKEVYDARTDIGRVIKQKNGELEGLPPTAPDTPDEEVSVSALAQRRMDAQGVQSEKARLLAEHRDVKEEVERLTARLAEIVAEGKALDADLLAVDIDALSAEIETADETNRAVRAKHQRLDLAQALGKLDDKRDALSDEIKAIDKAKADALARAKMPVEGLAFDAEGVLYNEVPFAQASGAERIKVSVAMAMALNPQLRVICIRDASLLDDTMMAAIEAMTGEQDFQVWYERVGDDDTATVVIEDGSVKS